MDHQFNGCIRFRNIKTYTYLTRKHKNMSVSFLFFWTTQAKKPIDDGKNFTFENFSSI